MLEAHTSSTEMARVLVQYIADPNRVQSLILSEFQRAPSIPVIRRMREEFLRPEDDRPEAVAWKIQEDRYADFMEQANRSFLRRLFDAHPYIQERAA